MVKRSCSKNFFTHRPTHRNRSGSRRLPTRRGSSWSGRQWENLLIGKWVLFERLTKLDQEQDHLSPSKSEVMIGSSFVEEELDHFRMVTLTSARESVVPVFDTLDGRREVASA
jgi:hypothetical protein